MTSKRTFVVCSLFIAICQHPAIAHSGSSQARIDQTVQIKLTANHIAITYITTLNRPAAFNEVLQIDTDGNGALSPEEQDRYFSDLQKRLATWLEANVNGEPAKLEPAGKVELKMPFTKTYRFTIKHDDAWQQSATFDFHNDNYLDTPGEIRITVEADENIKLLFNSLEQPDPSPRDATIRFAHIDAETTFADEPATNTSTEPQLKPGTISIPLISIISIACVPIALFVGRRFRGPFTVTACVALVGIAAATTSIARVNAPASWRRVIVTPDELQSEQIFQNLHRNIYDSFTAQTESDVYDTLAQSLDDNALETIYNEVYKAQVGREAGITSFKIRRIKPLETEVLPSNDGFRIRYNWRVYGTVTHFGHTHARFNEYHAIYNVAARAVPGNDELKWRIVDVNVLQHRRIDPTTTSPS